MSVEIDPTELVFHRPFTTEVSQVLKIRNPNHTPVAFKVKTTAPKQYCVRPNSGRIEPGKEVEVTVLLQAMKQEPPPDAKCRDKFLVQSVAVTADKEFTNITAIHVDDAERASVQEKKIRVMYGEKLGATPLKNGVHGTDAVQNTPDTAPPPAYSSARSPSPEETFTPSTRPSLTANASRFDDEPISAKSISESKVSARTSLAASSGSISPSYEELKAKLADAQATIASYAQEGGLRMRKAAQGESGSKVVDEVVNQIQTTQGVPLQIVAILCLVSFLLAYIFF
ncbi:hypothetical protein OIDMADRAFT_206175 [Oidiodendron maius Zn]|uniref:MSP domain-containing protein n=1 Tax=Oidiodendron maius (strain Zn) TaxID=913774 RepID=A0A0C3GG80_OIDMZ|nr:hypothetical protein OIDMADRAFT_206175 [Oidiodendron maius Zn]